MNVTSQAYIDGLYEEFLRDPGSLSAEWQEYFRNFRPSESASTSAKAGGGVAAGTAATQASGSGVSAAVVLQDRVDQLVRGFRVRGHLEAKLDPLGMARGTNSELNPESYGLRPEDLKKQVSSRTIGGADVRTLEELIEQMRTTYCRSIGAQFMHIDDHEVRSWLQERMESTQNRIQLDRQTQIRILNRLSDAVIFEEFVRKKFIGAKTFSLEGAETLIPLLDLCIEKSAHQGVKEVVLGMAHRGRLNVLANIMGKRAQNIFWSFDDPDPESNRGGGDVLYHMGYSNDYRTKSGESIHISLCFNPSHLEFVNPVALGRCRSKQDLHHDHDRSECLTVLIHGDASFIGEGIVQETLNLSQLEGYHVGGALHVIVNNQVGFTTNTNDSRSTTYASDIAKMLQVPIFHVNGEDPEAVAQVVELSLDFRHKFKRDVVIDMYCYRRLGHNESDEPRFTQPVMYRLIDARPTIRDSYLEHLLKLDGITREEADRIATARRNALERDLEESKQTKFSADYQSLAGYWNSYYGGPERTDDDIDTGASAELLSQVFTGLARLPSGFQLNKKLERMIASRAEMAGQDRPIDWATAELAAFGTLALEGHSVRLTGQDCERGTFSQRHGVLIDSETGAKSYPLKQLGSRQASVEIYNSPLSEAGVLGFEYGYSLDSPDSLVLWEAQFGDFWNVAQVIVDQFISSAEDKWRRLSGLVMLLPHGFEGAGPEHCSARMERFLTLAAEHNFQVTNPTTAAQYFHLLRRQVLRKWRKPLIVLTPKSLLRESLVMSNFAEFTSGRFQRVLPDPRATEITNPAKVVFCTGKVGIDLLKAREERGSDDLAIVRLEQMYPFPKREIDQVLSQYPAGTPVVWVQEEPRNMGAWYFMRMKWEEFELTQDWNLSVVCRPESASPSTGSKKAHAIEQAELLEQAFAVPSKSTLSRA
ncbi:MAG: 2-oxoglutarate dehydrogenase E1 component [Planctomycetota bacterium]